MRAHGATGNGMSVENSANLYETLYGNDTEENQQGGATEADEAVNDMGTREEITVGSKRQGPRSGEREVDSANGGATTGTSGRTRGCSF